MNNSLCNFTNCTNNYNYENKNRLIIFIISALVFFISLIFVIIFSVSKPIFLEYELNNINKLSNDSNDISESYNDDLLDDISKSSSDDDLISDI